MTLKLAVSRSRPPVPYGANLLNLQWPMARFFALSCINVMNDGVVTRDSAFGCAPYSNSVGAMSIKFFLAVMCRGVYPFYTTNTPVTQLLAPVKCRILTSL